MTATMQHWTTQKKCKCGKLMKVHYEQCGKFEARSIETEGGFFRVPRKSWPNYLYCLDCGRRHELFRFKREEN